MREIEYRGWDSHNKRWVYGLPIMDVRGHSRIQYDHVRYSIIVDPNSLGEYAGLKDKNDKKIYEGDIIKAEFSYATWRGYVYFDKGNFELVDSDKNGQYLALSVLSNIEIIGNIHENPELLKVE